MPDHCALPWQELFDDENETTISADADAASAATGKGEEQVDHQNSLWNSFANEKTRQEEEEIDALLLEAEEESAMDQFLLQAVDENEEQSDKDDLFLLHAAQYLP